VPDRKVLHSEAEFRLVVALESELTGERLDTLDMPIIHVNERLGVPDASEQLATLAEVMNFMSAQIMRVAVMRTLATCRFALCKGVLSLDEVARA
jgi:hypothetical protein